MKKILYPVIHVESTSQALENVNIAYDGGADGVFLINHSINYETFFRIHEFVYNEMLNKSDPFPIGINCLDLKSIDIIDFLNDSIPMFWADNALIDDSFYQDDAKVLKEKISQSGWKGKYFGGVAFKYQKPINDLERVSEVAATYCDIIVTSGPATGKPAPVEKLKRMKGWIDKKPLALASGITPENVADYKKYVDIFLVATSISKDFLNLDPVKLNNLIKQIRIM